MFVRVCYRVWDLSAWLVVHLIEANLAYRHWLTRPRIHTSSGLLLHTAKRFEIPDARAARAVDLAHGRVVN